MNKEKLEKILFSLLAIVMVGYFAYSMIVDPFKHIEDRNGEKQEVSVVIEMKDDEISSISIDETYTQDGERTTKKRLGASYGMKDVEGSKGEWNEQIKHLEMELIGTDGDIDLNDEGYPTDEDITSGCTINLMNIDKAIENAISNARK